MSGNPAHLSSSYLWQAEKRCGIVYKVLGIAELKNTADKLFIEQFGSHPINFDQ